MQVWTHTETPTNVDKNVCGVSSVTLFILVFMQRYINIATNKTFQDIDALIWYITILCLLLFIIYRKEIEFKRNNG